MVLLGSRVRLAKRNSSGSSILLCTGEHLVTSIQALLQPQQLIHSSQLPLKLHVRAGSEDIRFLLAWAKETSVISDLQFHSDPH